MKQRVIRLTGLLLMTTVLLLLPIPLRAEGIVYYGGYGTNNTTCGSSLLPCRTYPYARQRACNQSENYQDTFHVYHVYNGYVATCDMVGGSGLEPRTYVRNWQGYLFSMVLPTFIVFALTLAGTRWWRRQPLA